MRVLYFKQISRNSIYFYGHRRKGTKDRFFSFNISIKIKKKSSSMEFTLSTLPYIFFIFYKNKYINHPVRITDTSEGEKGIWLCHWGDLVECLWKRIKLLFFSTVLLDIRNFHFLAASSWRGCWVARWWKRFLRTRVYPTVSDGSLYSIRGLRSGIPGGGIARLFRTACCWCRSRRTAHGGMGEGKRKIKKRNSALLVQYNA